MLSSPSPSEPRQIVVIGNLSSSYADVSVGGGAIGCSSAYFLTHHALFNPTIHSVTILEADDIAGGSSGKSGGLLASWATPQCLAPLSFKTHADLAKKHGGDHAWGHRHVHAAEVELEAQHSVKVTTSSTDDVKHRMGPEGLDWLYPGTLKSYNEIGTPSNTAQVNSLLFTTTMANLATHAGATVMRGRATAIGYSEDKTGVTSVTYTGSSKEDGTTHILEATDIVVAAGPWTANLLPRVKLLTPRGHSVIARPSSDLSNHVLFPSISASPDATSSELISPDIYPRPPDSANTRDTVYASGPDDYAVPLPPSTASVDVDPARVDAVWNALRAVSGPIRDGEVLVRQACYKPQIREHEEDEEVGPMVGRYEENVRGLWVATGHDEWGMQNSAGTGLLISEMVWEGEAKSADAGFLDPKKWMKD